MGTAAKTTDTAMTSCHVVTFCTIVPSPFFAVVSALAASTHLDFEPAQKPNVALEREQGRTFSSNLKRNTYYWPYL